MKNRRLIIAFAVLLLLGFGCLWAAESQKSLTVQVREGQLRSTPSFVGKIIARPAYGEKVQVLGEEGAWKRVSVRGVQGWMHASALTTKTLIPQAGTANVQTSATGGEIALAGKGFSEEIEREYKKNNRSVDFTWVDRMEKFRVTPEEMQAFLRQGDVVPAEGGAR